MKHFEFTGETRIYQGRTLHRIRCTSKLDRVAIGEEGGWIESEANLLDNAWVGGEAIVCDHAKASGNSRVSGNAKVHGNAKVYGDARVYTNAQVYNNAEVYGNAKVHGNANVNRNAKIKQDMDYCVFQGFGSAGRTTTAFRTDDENIGVTCGCFSGTLSQFEERVKKIHGENQHGLEYMAIINVIKLRFNVEETSKKPGS